MEDVPKTVKSLAADLPAHVIRVRLGYDPLTGVFRWKVRPSNNVQIGAVAGCESLQGYVIRMFGQNYYARRLAWIHVHGDIPHGFEVFNRNRDRNDIRLANLDIRVAQERAISRPMLKPTQTAERNISLSDQGYRVQLYRDGKVIHRSRHTIIEAAIAARDEALSKYEEARR